MPAAGPIHLPDVVSPEGPGSMTIFQAALWIATCGGANTFDPVKRDHWRLAYGELLTRMASGEVRLSGMRGPMRETIDPVLLADCQVDYPFSDDPDGLMLKEELYLRSWPARDDEDWRGGFDDSLCVKFDVRWSRLLVPKSDVLALWPFAAEPPSRAGAPGRPTGAHLVRAEFEVVLARGEHCKTLAEQSRRLERWYRQHHPKYPKLTAKTIEGLIREAFNAAKAKTPKRQFRGQ